MADGETLYRGDSKNDQPSWTVEEIMRIIQAAKTPAQGSKTVEWSAAGLGGWCWWLDTDVDTAYTDDSGDFSANIWIKAWILQVTRVLLHEGEEEQVNTLFPN